MTTLENHVLYYKPTCPYCQKVLHFMAAHDLECALRNTLDDEQRRALVEIGGKQQVPCLVIDGKAMYESDDIIAYLRTKIA